jgi:hypothetical protein
MKTSTVTASDLKVGDTFLLDWAGVTATANVTRVSPPKNNRIAVSVEFVSPVSGNDVAHVLERFADESITLIQPLSLT